MHRDLTPGNEFIVAEAPAEENRARRLLGYLAVIGVIEIGTIVAEVTMGDSDAAALTAVSGTAIMIACGAFAYRLLHKHHEENQLKVG